MRVSVVIPALNAAATIGGQLEAIIGQCAGRSDVEIIVADNGSSDGTREAAARLGAKLPSLRVVDASARRGPSAARNLGAATAQGPVLAFTDADDIVMPGWLETVSGLATRALATGPVRWFGPAVPLSDSWGGAPGPPIHMNFLPYALGTNFIVSRELFVESGGFREDLQTAEDVELSWRFQLSGVGLTYLREARVAAIREGSSLRILRQYYRYGLRDPVLYSEFRERGAPRPSLGAVIRSYLGLVGRLPLLPMAAPRERWLHQAGRRAGRFVGSFRAGCFYP